MVTCLSERRVGCLYSKNTSFLYNTLVSEDLFQLREVKFSDSFSIMFYIMKLKEDGNNLLIYWAYIP